MLVIQSPAEYSCDGPVCWSNQPFDDVGGMRDNRLTALLARDHRRSTR